jgi:multimeric flavodoxin WrbA
MGFAVSKKRVLIIYYSFSGQTQLLIQRVAAGIMEGDLEVSIERLHPVRQIPFPFLSWRSMSRVMILSFFRKRVKVQTNEALLDSKWDMILLAGPTWSYSPSGPVLDFLDRYGNTLCKGTTVLPLISCRSYWRTHYWCLKCILNRLGARVLSPMVFLHSSTEPWRTIGLFLQLMGRLPRRESSWFRRRYPRYGHSREQYADALEQGRNIARMLADKDI